MNIDLEVARISEQQHGYFTQAQLDAIGVSPADRRWRLEAGRWERQYDVVYRIAGTPHTWKGDLLAGCWAGGPRGVASHRSAAALWEYAGRRTDIVEITCPRWRRARHPGLYVHESKALDARDITEVDGIPVTTPELTLVMLGAVCSPLVVEMALDRALRCDLVTVASTKQLLRRLGKQGRNGIGTLRRIVDERDPERAPRESEKETELFALLRRNGLPLPIPQYEIFHDGQFVARPDFAYVDAKLAIEYESYQEHTGKLALERDNARRNAMLTIGWTPLGVTNADIRSGGRLVCAQIRSRLYAADAL
jgi:very-short-patch-repair endonuclease